MIILSHPTGNANVRAAASGLVNAAMLHRFYTSVASFPGSPLDHLGSIEALSEIHRRRFDPALRELTRTRPWTEIIRLLATKLKCQTLVAHEHGPFSIDAVYQSIDRHVAKKLRSNISSEVTAVYAYEDGAHSTFTEAKSQRLHCLYDLPIGYWRTANQLLNSELDRWPDWGPTLIGFQDSEKKLERKDEELLLADQIFVASDFTARTLKDFPGKLAPIHVIPYGFPPPKQPKTRRLFRKAPMKILFVGGLSQRKGIAYLFAAVEGLEKFVELTLVGHKVGGECKPLNIGLGKHRWIPTLPHNKILDLMREHDVLVFPSLFEGFGLVITEAMSQGTPVITTERTAGPDLIEHDKSGWLINAGSVEDLKSVIEELLYCPQKLDEVSFEAIETARRRPWSLYGEELAAAIRQSGSLDQTSYVLKNQELDKFTTLCKATQK